MKALLDARADANARWCPFESRGPSDGKWQVCTFAKGMTPHIMATLLDDAEVMKLLRSANRRDGGENTNAAEGDPSTAAEIAK